MLSVMSIAAMGFGHLSMQFTLITVTLWFGAFWITFPMPRIRVVTTVIFDYLLVWFCSHRRIHRIGGLRCEAPGRSAATQADRLVSVILWATTVVWSRSRCAGR